MEFSKVVEKYGEEEYPYSTQGLWLYKKIKLTTTLFAVTTIINTTISWFTKWGESKNITGTIAAWIGHANTFTTVLLAANIIGYMVVVVLRWRRHERDVLENDRLSVKLRRELFKSMGLAKKRADATRVNGDGNLSDSQKLQKSALDCIYAAELQVNTRMAHDESNVERRFHIRIGLPSSHDIYKQLISETSELSQCWTRVLQGQMVIGDRMITPDQRWFVWSDTQIVPDVYKTVVVEEVEEDTEIYEYSFPLTCFVDRSGDVVKVTREAEQWTGRAGAMVDRLLSSKDSPAKRLDQVQSPSTLKLIYEVPFSLTGSGKFKAMAELCDEVFGLPGTRVLVQEGYLHLELPVPPKFRAPIDMRTMYREVFGNDGGYAVTVDDGGGAGGVAGKRPGKTGGNAKPGRNAKPGKTGGNAKRGTVKAGNAKTGKPGKTGK